MAPRATLNQDKIVALGVERLAQLVLEEASRSAPFKRIVTAALAATKGGAAVAAIVDRRLAGLEKARGFIDYDRRQAFVEDLASLVAVTTEELGRLDPASSAERLARFLGTAWKVLERVDDSSGSIQAVYEEAAVELAATMARMGGERWRLVERLVSLMLDDPAGLIEIAVVDLVPSLDEAERSALDDACRKAKPAQDAQTRNWRQSFRAGSLLRVRKAVADAGGDVDAFIALEQSKPEAQRDGLGVAERLFKAGRLNEALEQVRKPLGGTVGLMTREDVADRSVHLDLGERHRTILEIEILDAMGDAAAAQTLRHDTFRDQLDAQMLRDYVGKLPDFEDDDALDEAFAHVAAHPRRHAALAFFLRWPRLDLAAKLVRETVGWDGGAYDVLAPAAAALEEQHPVSATILYRAMVDEVLLRGRSQAYGHAARYVRQLESMAADLEGSGLDGHDVYRAALLKAHGRKSGFWDRLAKS